MLIKKVLNNKARRKRRKRKPKKLKDRLNKNR